MPPETCRTIDELKKSPRGILLLVPHTTLMEALTALPVLIGLPKRVSVLYRAFASPALERLVLGRREKHGVRLLNRSTGMREIIHELQGGQVGGLLFDQNSGDKGKLISFMGRIAAASDLADVVYRHACPIPLVFAIKRTGFWRGEVAFKQLEEPEEEIGDGKLEIGRGKEDESLTGSDKFANDESLFGT